MCWGVRSEGSQVNSMAPQGGGQPPNNRMQAPASRVVLLTTWRSLARRA